MSLPQTEDGFTRLANELLDAIIRFDFTKRQYAVLLAVVRKTYGYNKKADALSIYQISVMTGIDRAHISKAVSELHAMNVLAKAETGRMAHGQIVPEISINKNYKTWSTRAEIAPVSTDAKTALVPKQYPCQNSPNTDAVLVTLPMPKQHPHKDNYTKDIKDKGFNPQKQLIEDGVESEFVDAFLATRKANKKPLTLVAYNMMRREVHKAGWTMAQATQIAAENGWRGFKADYVAGKQPPQAVAPEFDLEAYKANKKAEATAGIARLKQDEAKFIVYPKAMQA